MDLPVDPIRMSVQEILARLETGNREALGLGPSAALKYLQGILQDSIDLPPTVVMVVHDLASEAQAELQDWEGCSVSVAKAQEARRRALAESPPPGVASREAPAPALPSPPIQELSQDLEGAFEPPLVVAPDTKTPPLAREATPLPPPVLGSLSAPKICCGCGKDVSHRARRKDPLTKTYLCRECFDRRPGSTPQPGFSLRRPVLWILLASLVGFSVALLLMV